MLFRSQGGSSKKTGQAVKYELLTGAFRIQNNGNMRFKGQLVPRWGDDTKGRKLSGSRSYGDAHALSNSSLNTIFKVPERRRRREFNRKGLFRDRNQTIKRMLFTLERRLDTVRGVFHSLNRREFTPTLKIVQLWFSRTGQF